MVKSLYLTNLKQKPMEFTKEELIAKNPNYRYKFLREEELRNELKNWNREELINWLSWNDPNGIYQDEESLAELGYIMTYEEGVEIMVRQAQQGKSHSLCFLTFKGENYHFLMSK